uniref:Capsid protein n=1 Tax=Cressdnaviricota sp. TaxID=2748378 RepID=A0A6M3YPD2_9VIRU|nr:MAG: capsid protein [Cressdnaviricota sp.]
MAKTYRKRRTVRRKRPVATRRTYYARKRVNRRRRNYRFRAAKSMDNTRKFHSKVYEQYVLPWHLPSLQPSPGTGNWQKFQRDILVGIFSVQNPQFYRNMFEYQWVKFNYIAIKVKELNYYGFLTTIKQEENVDISGMTSVNLDHLPMYFAWDLDQDMSFNKDDGTQLIMDPASLAQYPLAKKMYPGNRRGLTFLWKVPRVWRQFWPTSAARELPGVDSFGRFLTLLSGVNINRYPRRFMGSHQNIFFDSDLPQGGGGIKGKTVVAFTYHLGCTFSGRNVMGEPKASTSVYRDEPLDVEFTNQSLDYVEPELISP